MDAADLTLPVVAGAALLDGLNPCSFAVLLTFVGVALVLAERSGASGARGQLWRTGFTFIFGVFLAYLALGLGGWTSLRGLAGGHWVGRVTALAAVGLGVVTLQEALVPEWGVRLSPPPALGERLRALSARGSLPAVFGAGVLVSLCTVPCSGAIYLAVLALLARQPTWMRGVGYLVLYNALFVLPLVALLVLASSRPVFNRLGRWQLHHRRTLKFGMGVGALILGLLLLAML
ncbi:MAG: cytochrome c biogenesis protein CcdA [Armatimonadota bacterium]|nr:cytochrome c biogenesis protein CcdA [Armatimonadota bacterium]MDR7564021.1 cytochrome c biogenesis protein CcdA [Armatimonadota bacterium]MDR7568777.1 cytochrome c biogenesis protein CcdA [Armatimonadota bacterium]MDR7602939.1 cytochrome c biogenesis protein CcdA [Armatimonadota bacterium]